MSRPSRVRRSCRSWTANRTARNLDGLWQLTPRQVVDELFESDAVKTLVLSQMAIPRGVGIDYGGGGIEVLKLIAGDEKPELARGGSHSIAQVLQRAYVHNGGQIRAVHHVDKILVERRWPGCWRALARWARVAGALGGGVEFRSLFDVRRDGRRGLFAADLRRAGERHSGRRVFVFPGASWR